jgi:hypothetical protein
MSAFWSMFWFKPFRNFLRKIAIFRNFDHWSELLSMSAGRPLSQGVCPPLLRGACLSMLVQLGDGNFCLLFSHSGAVVNKSIVENRIFAVSSPINTRQNQFMAL